MKPCLVNDSLTRRSREASGNKDQNAAFNQWKQLNPGELKITTDHGPWLIGKPGLKYTSVSKTHTCWFLWFTGTLHRCKGFYTVQTVCAIALHLPYT